MKCGDKERLLDSAQPALPGQITRNGPLGRDANRRSPLGGVKNCCGQLDGISSLVTVYRGTRAGSGAGYKLFEFQSELIRAGGPISFYHLKVATVQAFSQRRDFLALRLRKSIPFLFQLIELAR